MQSTHSTDTTLQSTQLIKQLTVENNLEGPFIMKVEVTDAINQKRKVAWPHEITVQDLQVTG